MKNQLNFRGNRQSQSSLSCVVFLFLLVLLAILAAACDKETPLAVDDQSSLPMAGRVSSLEMSKAQSIAIASVREIGAIGKPPSVSARDGGASAIIGGQLLWYFGDTFFNPPSVNGKSFFCNTAALANPTLPLVVSEPLDANGAPAAQFVPFTATEQVYNDSTKNANDRYALWPGTVLPDGKSGGLVFYADWKIQPGGGSLNYQFIGTGLAQVKKGKTVAARLSGFLFNAPDPIFDKAFILGSYVYVYGNIKNNNHDVVVARVPLTQVKKRTAYSFWDGANWVAAVSQAKPILYGIPGAVSVSYNAYLKQYLAIYSYSVSFGSSRILTEKISMSTANSPEGPWSIPVDVFTGRTSTKGYNYAGREHPELAQSNGQTIFITYYNPQGTLKGELYLVEVKF